jgi:hypothetical protein
MYKRSIKTLTSEEFAYDNPYSVRTIPRMFMMYKYFDEEKHESPSS